MLFRLKSANTEAKADRIAAAHGCQIVPVGGGHPRGTRALDALDIYRHQEGITKTCLAALEAAGCICGITAAPKPRTVEVALYRPDTGGLISRHRTTEAAVAAGERLTRAARRPINQRNGYIRTALAEGPRGSGWSPTHDGERWVPAGAWDAVSAQEEDCDY